MKYRYIVVIYHPEIDGEVRDIHQKIELMKDISFKCVGNDHLDISIFTIETESLKAADNLAVVLNDLRQGILKDPANTIECNIVNNVMRL